MRDDGGPAGRLNWSRLGSVATVVTLAVFAAGVGPHPHGRAWSLFHDVVLYNLIYVLAALVCLGAARHNRHERTAWSALAVALALSVVGNVVYSLWIAHLDPQPYPSVADVFYLLYYVPLYVALLALVRARVPRFHASMWLDGVIGALGAAALAVALLLGPALQVTAGDPAAVVTSLAYPLADILLLALLGVVGGVLGLRGDRSILLLVGGMVANLVGDIIFVNLAAQDVYVEGGPLDLSWLGAVALIGLAAHAGRHPRPAPARDAQPPVRVGWRVMAVPLTFDGVSLLVLAFDWGDRLSDVAAACAVGCIAASLARSAVTFRELREFHAVREQARTDELTGLPNRRALLQRAGELLLTATAGQPVALLLLDLDGFKEVNDSLGHPAGDELLVQVGPRLRGVLRHGDLLARLGGDEFAVLLPGTDYDRAHALAVRLREQIGLPFSVHGVRLHLDVSIGVATAPVPAVTVAELLRCADVAMYTAKAAGDGVRGYVPDPGNASGERLRTMEELRTALAAGELTIHLQPQVGLADGRPVGVEALVRWRHPERGLLAPAAFLPAAEHAGLLRPLTDTVLELALGAAAGWWDVDAIPVSVNLSAANVTDLDLPAKVAAALDRHGLPPQALTLELVEETLMTDPDRGRTVLAELRRLGVRTAIDDYGTGYSSLAHLRGLPADELKLDRSLTADVDSDPRAAVIVKHTVALAHELSLRLVAEGVERPATAERLAGLGCDVVQGFAVARPMPVEEFHRWLRQPTPSLPGGHALP